LDYFSNNTLSNELDFNQSFLLDLGVLACLDGFMNIALEQTEEFVNSQLKNKYGDAFIRGNNGFESFFSIYFLYIINF